MTKMCKAHRRLLEHEHVPAFCLPGDSLPLSAITSIIRSLLSISRCYWQRSGTLSGQTASEMRLSFLVAQDQSHFSVPCFSLVLTFPLVMG